MRYFLLVMALILCSSGAIANDDKAVKGDIEYGEYLSGECVTCHSKAGLDKGIPSIIAMDAESMVSLLNAYKSKELENEAMRLIAARLGDEEIAALAVYFASLPEPE